MEEAPTVIIGARPVSKEILDLNSAQVLKAPRHITDKLVTKEQLTMSPSSSPPPPPPPLSLVPSMGSSQPNLSAPIAPFTSPGTTPPAAYPPTPPAPTIPVPAEVPPILPSDSTRVQDRINKLYGKMKTAEERAEDLARENAELRSLRGGSQPLYNPQPPLPTPPSFNAFSYPSSPPQPGFESGSPPAGPQPEQPLTRGELFAALNHMTQVITAQSALSNAHSVSRSEAERDFPDVFQDPRLKQAADDIWARDPALKRDPMGPYKAAILARGLYGITRAEAPAPVAPPATVRKEALSAIGASVPEGSGAPNDRATRYAEALSRYQMSGNENDLVVARLIQSGAL